MNGHDALAHSPSLICRIAHAQDLFLFPSHVPRPSCHPQDTFLPHVECGTITLIGATTENPSFQVNSALLSRCRVLVLEKLSVTAVSSILHRATDSLGLIVLPDERAGQDCSAE